MKFVNVCWHSDLRWVYKYLIDVDLPLTVKGGSFKIRASKNPFPWFASCPGALFRRNTVHDLTCSIRSHTHHLRHSIRTIVSSQHQRINNETLVKKQNNPLLIYWFQSPQNAVWKYIGIINRSKVGKVIVVWNDLIST